MKKNNILIRIPQYETSFDDICNKQYCKINGLMHMIEKEFSVSLHDHPELRNEILDISNFIKRLPNMVSEIVVDKK